MRHTCLKIEVGWAILFFFYWEAARGQGGQRLKEKCRVESRRVEQPKGSKRFGKYPSSVIGAQTPKFPNPKKERGSKNINSLPSDE